MTIPGLCLSKLMEANMASADTKSKGIQNTQKESCKIPCGKPVRLAAGDFLRSKHAQKERVLIQVQRMEDILYVVIVI